jgi:hypothetical protein
MTAYLIDYILPSLLDILIGGVTYCVSLELKEKEIKTKICAARYT